MKVSVCMATYNGAKYLREQIDSILYQDLSKLGDIELELIVSDDSSTDETINILKSYKDDRIKIYHHEKMNKHKWYCSAFACTSNFGNAIKYATGDFIFLSDQDDVWYPWKIEKTLNKLIEYGGVVGCAFDIGDVNMHCIGSVVYKHQSFFRLRYEHSLYGFSCGFSKEELKYIYPFPIIPFYDTFIMLSAQLRNRLHFVNEKCAMHRWSGEHNVSSARNNIVPFAVKIYYKVLMWLIVVLRFTFY